MKTVLYFDFEALAAALAIWDAAHGPAWVSLTSDGYPDDPRACDPGIIDFIHATFEDRGMEVEFSNPGCQVWSEPNKVLTEAGAALATLLFDHRPLPPAEQAIMAAMDFKNTRQNWGTDVRVLRISEGGHSSFIEFESFGEAAQAHETWLSREHKNLLTGCFLKCYVRDLPPVGPFIKHIGDGLPELVQVAMLFWPGGHTFAISRLALDGGSFLPLQALTKGEAYDFAWARLTELPGPA
jgi:hypothetical protein